MRDLQLELAEVTKIYGEERFDEALELIESMPKTELGLIGYCFAADIYASGRSSRGTDYGKALEYYAWVDDAYESLGSLGSVGIARTLFKKACCANQDLIESHCRRAMQIDGSLPANFILAQMYEECQGRFVEARQLYLHVFRHCRPYGLRHFARSHMAHGNIFIGAIAHVFTTIVSPICFVINRGAIHPEIR